MTRTMCQQHVEVPVCCALRKPELLPTLEGGLEHIATDGSDGIGRLGGV